MRNSVHFAAIRAGPGAPSLAIQGVDEHAGGTRSRQVPVFTTRDWQRLCSWTWLFYSSHFWIRFRLSTDCLGVNNWPESRKLLIRNNELAKILVFWLITNTAHEDFAIYPEWINRRRPGSADSLRERSGALDNPVTALIILFINFAKMAEKAKLKPRSEASRQIS
jgi:hypothetical protein